MNIWIVTIGSSDVQLDSDRISSEKGRNEKQRSNKFWSYWYEDTKPDCYDIAFEPKQAYKDLDESYRIEARVLGSVYESSSQKVKDEIWSYLTFPLLDKFVEELRESPPDAIALLLTDQSEIFKHNSTTRKPKCAYWQDTCKLEPILKRYFQDKFPEAKYKPIFLSPTSGDKGLDDWNYVLELVRENLRTIEFDGKEIKNEEIKTVYVSHQAGTPAISSAVQFVCLARFRTNVEFLVSNEQNLETRKISRSNYLRAIQLQEAKALLERHDYAGLMALLKPYLNRKNPKERRIRSLLKAGIQWNLAKFNNFKGLLIALKITEKSDFLWYWMGYESAYLAVIRHQQGNIVEALFHGFRAAEGLICNWAEEKYKQYIYYNDKGSPQITEEIKEVFSDYWNKIEKKNEKWITESKEKNEKRQKKGEELVPISVGLFSQSLYLLLEMARPEVKKNSYMKIVLYSAKDERNQQFHRLLGLREKDLFKAWKADSVDSWKSILLGSLNFIAKEDLSQEFTSPEEASLMSKVHQELVNAIAPNNLQR